LPDPTGTKPADGATRNIFRGEHSSLIAYQAGDEVTNSDGSELWTAIADVPAGIALGDPAYWSLKLVSGAGTPGQAAVTMRLSRAAATVFAYANGNVPDWSQASGKLTVYEGEQDVTSSATLSYTETNLTGSLTANGNYAVTAMPMAATSGTLTMTAQYKGKTYSADFSVSKVLTGYEIVSSLPASNLFEGREVYLETDKKRYIVRDGAWELYLKASEIEYLGDLLEPALIDLADKTDAALEIARSNSMWMPWSQWSLGAVNTLETISDGVAGDEVLRLRPGSGAANLSEQLDYIALDRSRVYRVNFWARPSADANGSLWFALRQYQDDSGALSPNNVGLAPYKPGGRTRAQHVAEFGNGWGLYSFLWSAPDWQAETKFLRPALQPNYQGTTGYWEIQGGIWIDATETDLSAQYSEAANTSRIQAQAARDAASGHATAASTSASNASASATTAGNHASAANTSRINAETARSQAQAASTTAVSAKDSAEDAASSAQTSMVLAASVANNSMNANPVFSNWATGSTMPANWSLTGGTVSRVTTGALSTSPYAVRVTGPAGGQGGFYQTIGSPTARRVKTGDYFLLEADILLTAGTLQGAGVWLYGLNQTGAIVYPGAAQNFATTPDHTGTGPGNGVVGQRYTFASLVQMNQPGIHHLRLQLFTHSGAEPTANELVVMRCSVRAATHEEILGRSTSATVSVQAGAIATLQGENIAYWQAQGGINGETNWFMTGKARAAYGQAPSGTVALGADKFYVYNPSGGGWIKTLEVTAGLVRVYGRMAANTVDTDAIFAGAVTAAKVAATNVITMSAQIGNGVIQSANIGQLQVKEANIENLTVGTQKITHNAVTTNWYTSASNQVSFDTSGGVYSLLSLTIVKSEDDSVLDITTVIPLRANDAIDGLVYIRIRTGGMGGPVDVVRTRNYLLEKDYNGGSADVVSIGTMHDDMPAGTYGVEIVFQRNTNRGSWTTDYRYLKVTEDKR